MGKVFNNEGRGCADFDCATCNYTDGCKEKAKIDRKTRKVHLIDLRLSVMRGWDIPTCQANVFPFDMNKGRWDMANVTDAVTCKHCLKAIKNGRWK